jgi:hypothetical protein
MTKELKETGWKHFALLHTISQHGKANALRVSLIPVEVLQSCRALNLRCAFLLFIYGLRICLSDSSGRV